MQNIRSGEQLLFNESGLKKLKQNLDMKSKCLFLLIVFSFSIVLQGQDTPKKPDKTIFVTGGSFGRQYIQYLASITNKPNSKICFVPTASADNAQSIANWYANCEDLPVKPYVLRTFI